MNIGVDVDITLFRTDLSWLEHLNFWSGKNIELFSGEVYPYDLSSLFPKEEMTPGKGGIAYWKERDIYDNILPRPNSVYILKELSNMGHKIIFVSTIKGDHHKSKYFCLKRHFPFLDGALWTREKHFVDLDVMIDDRKDVLSKFDGTKTFRILMESPYEQLVEGGFDISCQDWNDERLLQL